MNQFNDLRTANKTRDAIWDPEEKIGWSFRGNELAGEVGELCNQLKKLDRQALGLRGSAPDIENIFDELADVIICVDLIAMDLNINLWAAVKAKFNKTSDEHGLAVKL
jgi:NTP pyrophosphatase (non-canonical NTP hydrolase)